MAVERKDGLVHHDVLTASNGGHAYEFRFPAVAEDDRSLLRAAPFTVGGSNVVTTADYGFSGHIGSVSVYTRALDDASMAAAVAKLKADWGVP